jgi:hypothetical protein
LITALEQRPIRVVAFSPFSKLDVLLGFGPCTGALLTELVGALHPVP